MHLPPVWKVDAALNACRDELLEKLRKEVDGLGVFDADGGYLIERDGEFLAYIHANDNWIMRQDGYCRMPGHGLASFLSFWRGEDLPTTIARLAMKFRLGGAE